MKQIIALGGGGFSMEPRNKRLDQYILQQSSVKNPAICFIPTASGDSKNYTQRFYRSFNKMNCKPSHLWLFKPNFENLEEYILKHDIIYVGGGNTRNMLLIWRELGLDKILKKAYDQGVILCGLSAGSICWFEEGLTDPENAPMYSITGIGLLRGSHCPHYNNSQRQTAYTKLIKSKKSQAGYAAEDGAALHFINGTLTHVVGSRKEANGYFVQLNEDSVQTTRFEIKKL